MVFEKFKTITETYFETKIKLIRWWWTIPRSCLCRNIFYSHLSCQCSSQILTTSISNCNTSYQSYDNSHSSNPISLCKVIQHFTHLCKVAYIQVLGLSISSAIYHSQTETSFSMVCIC